MLPIVMLGRPEGFDETEAATTIDIISRSTSSIADSVLHTRK